VQRWRRQQQQQGQQGQHQWHRHAPGGGWPGVGSSSSSSASSLHTSALSSQDQQRQPSTKQPPTATTTTSAEAASPPRPPPLPPPSADECDTALATYDAARSQQHSRRRLPSTYKTTSQRALELVRATLSGLIAAGRWLACLPTRVASLSRWSRSDWAAWWGRTRKVVREEAHHYWLGSKLLAVEVRIASGLALRAARGEALTRRERRQLTRTTADVFRLVPLLVVVLIPFMELALPLLLKIFPNMLPSTFEDKLRKEEEIKRRVQVKIEVARFLQDTVAQMASEIRGRRGPGSAAAASADELYRFMGRVRSGAPVDNAELIRFASLFSDELTLENLDRVQVVSLCQLLGLPPYGTDGYLRSRLRAQLGKIKKDDAVISAEGLDRLEDDELRAALRARGMRGVYGAGADAYMRAQLRGWLDLSLNHGLPSSLLLLSRAFALTGEPAPAAAGAAPATPVLRAEAATLSGVRETLLTLPEQAVHTAGLEAEVAGGGGGGGGGVGRGGGASSAAAAAAASSAGAAPFEAGLAAAGSAMAASSGGAGEAGPGAPAAPTPPSRADAAALSLAARSEAFEKKLELVRKEQELIRKERELLDAQAAAARAEAEAEAASAGGAPATEPSSSPAAAAAAAASANKALLELALEGERGPGGAPQAAAGASVARGAAAAAAAQAVLSEAAAGLALKGLDDAAALAGSGASDEERAAAAAAAREARMRDILSALTVLASSSGVAREREQFMELVRRELDRLAESVPGSPSLMFTGGALQSVRPEDHVDEEEEDEEAEEAEEAAAAEAEAAAATQGGAAADGADGKAAPPSPPKGRRGAAERGELALSRALEERVSGILHRIELELDEADKAIGGSLHVIDADGDGLISRDELQAALRFLRASLDEQDLEALLGALKVTTPPSADGGAGGGEGGAAGEDADGGGAISVASLRALAESGDERLAAAAEKAAKAAAAQKAAAAAASSAEVEKIHTM